ncbi:hypothetical protein R6Z07M_015562 [Ovis aries]
MQLSAHLMLLKHFPGIGSCWSILRDLGTEPCFTEGEAETWLYRVNSCVIHDRARREDCLIDKLACPQDERDVNAQQQCPLWTREGKGEEGASTIRKGTQNTQTSGNGPSSRVP